MQTSVFALKYCKVRYYREDLRSSMGILGL
jgi:hypothetical protein